jgi:hypothetical protein
VVFHPRNKLGFVPFGNKEDADGTLLIYEQRNLDATTKITYSATVLFRSSGSGVHVPGSPHKLSDSSGVDTDDESVREEIQREPSVSLSLFVQNKAFRIGRSPPSALTPEPSMRVSPQQIDFVDCIVGREVTSSVIISNTSLYMIQYQIQPMGIENVPEYVIPILFLPFPLLF